MKNKINFKKTSFKQQFTFKEWEKFWKDQFDWTVDFSGVFIPPKPTVCPTGYVWSLLIEPKGMTNNQMFAHWKQLFECSKCGVDNIDKAVSFNARTTKNHYAIWILEGIDPSMWYPQKPTLEIDTDRDIGMTLLERMTLELKIFLKTGEHIYSSDIWCSGSRAGGGVPTVYYSAGSHITSVYWVRIGHGYGDSIYRTVSS